MEEQVKANIKNKYPWLSDADISICYDMAMHDFIRLSYPSQNSRPAKQDIKMDFLVSQWLYARMVDIFDRAGGISVTSYRENGINWSYGASYIDPVLVALIMPKVGIPK